MVFLLDTNAISDLMRRDPNIERRLRVAVPTVVRGEVLYGIERLPTGKRKADLQAEANVVLDSLPPEPVPHVAADVYAALKASCERRGIVLDGNELWLAATALALDATLVSRERDF